jgi:hypothetical protein
MSQWRLTCPTDLASWLVNLLHGALVLRPHCCSCAVLSDANKRFLYDVGVYEEEEDDDSVRIAHCNHALHCYRLWRDWHFLLLLQLQGMGDFLGEMAHMMNQTRPAVRTISATVLDLMIVVGSSNGTPGPQLYLQWTLNGRKIHA